MSSITLSGSSSKNRCPPPLTTRRVAAGISRAMILGLASGTIGSSSPAMISAGWVTLRSQGTLVQPVAAYSW